MACEHCSTPQGRAATSRPSHRPSDQSHHTQRRATAVDTPLTPHHHVTTPNPPPSALTSGSGTPTASRSGRRAPRRLPRPRPLLRRRLRRRLRSSTMASMACTAAVLRLRRAPRRRRPAPLLRLATPRAVSALDRRLGRRLGRNLAARRGTAPSAPRCAPRAALRLRLTTPTSRPAAALRAPWPTAHRVRSADAEAQRSHREEIPPPLDASSSRLIASPHSTRPRAPTVTPNPHPHPQPPTPHPRPPTKSTCRAPGERPLAPFAGRRAAGRSAAKLLVAAEEAIVDVRARSSRANQRVEGTIIHAVPSQVERPGTLGLTTSPTPPSPTKRRLVRRREALRRAVADGAGGSLSYARQLKMMRRGVTRSTRTTHLTLAQLALPLTRAFIPTRARARRARGTRGGARRVRGALRQRGGGAHASQAASWSPAARPSLSSHLRQRGNDARSGEGQSSLDIGVRQSGRSLSVMVAWRHHDGIGGRLSRLLSGCGADLGCE